MSQDEVQGRTEALAKSIRRKFGIGGLAAIHHDLTGLLTAALRAERVAGTDELLGIMRRIVRIAKMGRYRDRAQLSLGATPLIEEADAAIRKYEQARRAGEGA